MGANDTLVTDSMCELELFILSELKKNKRLLLWRVSLSDWCGKENRDEEPWAGRGRVAGGEGNRTAQLAVEGARLQGGEPLFRETPQNRIEAEGEEVLGCVGRSKR